ncbi:MAG: hypothetical protein R2711_08000 [Acidimicrobiales bacterium]
MPTFDVHDSMTIDPALIAISCSTTAGPSQPTCSSSSAPRRRSSTDAIASTRVWLRRLHGALATPLGGELPGHVDPDDEADEAELLALLRPRSADVVAGPASAAEPARLVGRVVSSPSRAGWWSQGTDEAGVDHLGRDLDQVLTIAVSFDEPWLMMCRPR